MDFWLRLMTTSVGLLESWPVPSGAENFQMRELMGHLDLENQVIEGMMGQFVASIQSRPLPTI